MALSRSGAWRQAHKEHARATERRYYARNKEKLRAKNAAYRAANREKMNQLSRAWEAKNPERVKATAALWRSKNKKRCAESHRLWVRNNPAAARLIEARAEGKRVGAKGVCSPLQLQARVEFYGGRCAYCEGPFESIDHVIPLARGGTNWPANLRPACVPCNSSKGAQPLLKWLSRSP